MSTIGNHAIADANDALEAFNSFNNARNILFWLFLLMPLLFIEVSFWTVNHGVVDSVISRCDETAESAGTTDAALPEMVAVAKAEVTGKADKPAVDASPKEIIKAHVSTQIAEPVQTADVVEKDGDKSFKEDPCVLVADAKGDVTPTVVVGKKRLSESLDKLLRAGLLTSNYILSFAAVTYCLALLIGIKLALIGRLGGLADSSKAFFLSLIVMVLILPWQHAISNDIHGTLFGYTELIERYSALQTSDDPKAYVFYYGRFVGLWVLTMLLLIVAQWRSGRAIKKIRSRLSPPPPVPVPEDNSAIPIS